MDCTQSTGSIRILVVDDHPFFCEGLLAWIARQPELQYCGCAASPEAALLAVEKLKPELVLLDLRLRDGDGMDLLRRLAARERGPRVIVVSHKDERLFAERALRAGACGYVAKEEACEMLLTAIATVRQGGIHVSDAARRMLDGGGTWCGEAGERDRLRGLSNRELQVFGLLGGGHSVKEIASELNVSVKTIEAYRESLKRKLGFASGAELIRFATLRTAEE